MTSTDIAIVNYNTRDLLRACLRSLQASDAGQVDQVVVVDNASADGSADMVQAEFPWVRLCRSEHNAGYAGAANQAMARCQARYVFLLNSDTLLRAGALPALARHLDRNPAAAIVGPRLVSADGSPRASCYPFPTPIDVFLDLSTSYRLIQRVPWLRDQFARTRSQIRPARVPWVLGAALLIRRAAFEQVGGFDESFFMYYEEVDLCYRLTRAGWNVHFAPNAEVAHLGGASTRQAGADMIVQLYASLAQFYRRHYSEWQLTQLTLLISIAALARLVRDTRSLRRESDPGVRADLSRQVLAWRLLLGGGWRSSPRHA